MENLNPVCATCHQLYGEHAHDDLACPLDTIGGPRYSKRDFFREKEVEEAA